MTHIRVFITFDVDQDDANTTAERTQITWRGLEKKVPAIHELFSSKGIKYTFFVRCDNQIQDLYGSYLGIYHRYQSLWDELRASDNEFGWHPHLYECRDHRYYPLRRPEDGCRLLRAIGNEVQGLPFPVPCIRIGEAWQTTEMMCTLDEMGIRIDSTAVPGRFRNDEKRAFDWEPTPNSAYHPSRGDYRVPSAIDALQILEVPMTTAPIMTDYDKAPLLRYLDLTYHPHLFDQWLDTYLSTLDGIQTHDLVAIFHPDELLAQPANGLHAYGWEAFERNTHKLVRILSESGHEFEFCCLSEALQ